MATFKELYMEVLGVLPDLPMEQAKRYINRAQRDAWDAWPWSWLVAETDLNVPDEVSDGTISVTQGSNVIVADATAAPVWAALGSFIPLEGRSLKIGTDFPYNILAFDSVDTVYVDRPFTGATDAAASYQLYQPYYAPPADFGRWIAIMDTVNSWNLITGKKQEWLDWIDPQRSNIGGPAQFVAFYKQRLNQTVPIFGANLSTTPISSTPLWELWPAPTAATTLHVLYKRKGVDMTLDTEESFFNDELLISRALYYGYRFAQSNMNMFPGFKGQRVGWVEMKKDANDNYLYELGQAIKRDDNFTLESIISKRSPWVPSSSWLQSHLTPREAMSAYGFYY